jgi:hypothetical protein
MSILPGRLCISFDVTRRAGVERRPFHIWNTRAKKISVYHHIYCYDHNQKMRDS